MYVTAIQVIRLMCRVPFNINPPDAKLHLSRLSYQGMMYQMKNPWLVLSSCKPTLLPRLSFNGGTGWRTCPVSGIFHMEVLLTGVVSRPDALFNSFGNCPFVALIGQPRWDHHCIGSMMHGSAMAPPQGVSAFEFFSMMVTRLRALSLGLLTHLVE